MRQAVPGDKVKIHYTGELEDGTLVDTTEGREPFELIIGEGSTIPGLEMGLTGMAEGDTRTLHIDPEDGFGRRKPDRMETIKRNKLPKDLKPVEGMHLQVPDSDGGYFRATVVSVDNEKIVIDVNHPLAGKKLKFEVKLVEIVSSGHLPEPEVKE